MQKQAHSHEVILRGLPISKGIGIGFPIFFAFREEEVLESHLSLRETEEEIKRYKHALTLSRQDLERLQKLSHQEQAPEVTAILGTHLEMMEDPLITQKVEEQIRLKQKTTETIFQHLIAEYQNRFNVLQDNYFKERVRDIVDLSRRILSHLRPGSTLKMAEMIHNSIILAHELVPSETIEANASLVSGFITAAGGLTSHAAIIARAKGIPYVANIDIKFLKRVEFQSVIVDGSEGLVIVNPSSQTLKKYQEIKKSYLEKDQLLQSEMHLKGETIDGYEIQVFANLEYPKEIDLSLKLGASGIGLFRSEYLFLARKAFPTEDEQFTIYRQMLQTLKGRPLIIRIFDVGGEKKGDLPASSPDAKYFLPIGRETNPALGCRAIRFLLRYPELLEKQLSAILRASHFGDIQVLIPMVSDISEIHHVRNLIHKIQTKLTLQGIPTAPTIPLGSMIEVPSTAILSDVIAREVDFLSIGTNDLIQYLLAADRMNPHTSTLYSTIHPSLLRLIQITINAANQARKPLLLCGECANDPSLIPLFIGLGIRRLSVASRHIPQVKHIIRKWRILEACRLAEGALELTSASDLKSYLKKEVCGG